MLRGQGAFPPWDLWNDAALAAIRDRSTLELTVTQRTGYAEVYFTSNPSARWFDEKAPYAPHIDE